MRIKEYFYRTPVSCIVAFALLLPFSISPSKAVALSIEDERKMGQEFVSQIRRHFELMNDDFANHYFNNLGQYLLSSLETRPFSFRFYIIKDKTLNAFAAPGGHVFFYSGLINIMDNVDELAGILCHEIAHVSARHMAGRIEKSKKIGIATLAGILAGVLIGGEAASALMLGSMAAGTQAQLYYSRNDERHADQLGFKYMQPSGFDPRGLTSTLRKLGEANWIGPNQVPTYLLTHPTGPERMSNLDSMMSSFTPKPLGKEATQFKEFFPLFQTVVKAKSVDSKEAEKIFMGELEKNPDSVSSHFGLGIVYMEKQAYEQAVYHLKKALLKRPYFVLILVNLGVAYQMNGDDQMAISVLEKAMKLDDENRSIPYFLGVSYENMGQYEKAIQLFKRLASFKPVKNDVFYHLGISYGKQDMLGLAHYNFGIFFKRQGQRKKAMFHFQKALELSGSDQKLKEKIKKESTRLGRKRE